jgi:N-acetylglucosamine-6-sulfatase
MAVLGTGTVLGRFARFDAPHEVVRRTRQRGGHGRPTQPNIVVIFADDMRKDEARYMPKLQRLLVAKGTTFDAARHNIALCSPARAGFLTGQYSKRHQVRSQRDTFVRHNDVNKTLAVWLETSGYHTGIIGKYFTAIEGDTSHPGWDIRRQLVGKSQDQYDYGVWNGEKTLTPSLDQTRYLEREVVDFLEGAREPFFLWFTPTAGHTPFQAPPAHKRDGRVSWPDLREDDVTDKPSWIQSLSPITDEVLTGIRNGERKRVRELLGLDDTIAAIIETLQSEGKLTNTVIIFTSDNGILWGEHRIPPGSKNLPYEPAVLVPCVVRGPNFPHTTIRQPVQMSIDLTATCVELAGATPDLALDGVSLAKVVADPSQYDGRELLYDRDDREAFTFPPPTGLLPPPAGGIFTRNRKLVRYKGEPATYELYDLDADPDELINVADHPSYANDRSQLERALDRLLAT